MMTGRERTSASSVASLGRLQHCNARDHHPAECSNNFHNPILRARLKKKQVRRSGPGLDDNRPQRSAQVRFAKAALQRRRDCARDDREQRWIALGDGHRHGIALHQPGRGIFRPARSAELGHDLDANVSKPGLGQHAPNLAVIVVSERDLIEHGRILLEVAGNRFMRDLAKLVVLDGVPHIEKKQAVWL